MTFIRIAGDEYDLTSALELASLRSLKTLKVVSERDGFAVTPKSMVDVLGRLESASKQPGFDTVELMGDERFLSVLQGLVFLAKRQNGEEVTFDEAGDFAPAQIELFEKDDPSDPKDDLSDPEGSNP